MRSTRLTGRKRWATERFRPQKRGADVGKTKKGKGTKIMLMIDGNGTPLSVFTLSANQVKVNALENLVDIRVTKKKLK